MSCPDLKMIAESLLYKNCLFTIKEQEDCRESAQNLVDFIQHLRLSVSISSHLLILNWIELI
jgi:hypothetical protein